MSAQGRTVLLELTEHDALQLITLIRGELYRTDKAWRPYWMRVAQNIQRGIEQASLKSLNERSGYFKDLSGEL